MKLVDNKVEEYIQKPGIEGIYEAIHDNKGKNNGL